jgi:hypothetical protein
MNGHAKGMNPEFLCKSWASRTSGIRDFCCLPHYHAGLGVLCHERTMAGHRLRADTARTATATACTAAAASADAALPRPAKSAATFTSAIWTVYHGCSVFARCSQTLIHKAHLQRNGTCLCVDQAQKTLHLNYKHLPIIPWQYTINTKREGKIVSTEIPLWRS